MIGGIEIISLEGKGERGSRDWEDAQVVEGPSSVPAEWEEKTRRSEGSDLCARDCVCSALPPLSAYH